MSRKILHLDLDAFFCAVEEISHPGLKGKPFAVGGQANQRGVVASCSYAARMFGVRSAMPMGRAQRLCPELIVVASNHADYSKVSKKVMALIEISPLIEKISIDEAFIDVTGTLEPLIEIARMLQKRVNNEMGLPVSIGGATNKLVAKIANDWGKSQNKRPSPPNTITIIPPGEEASFLAPLPVQSLWGIGPKSADRMNGLGIKTIGSLANTPAETLELLFGRSGRELRDRALGIDRRSVETEHEVKSISNETTFAQDLTDEDRLLKTLRHLSDQVGKRLRKASLAGATIQIKLRWSDFTTITRQVTLPSTTNLDQDIFEAAAALFLQNWDKTKPVRLVGVGVTGLGEPTYQLRLWGDSHQKKANLVNTMDSLRNRFGKDIIKRADQLLDQADPDAHEDADDHL